jgi:hypothetical protein
MPSPSKTKVYFEGDRATRPASAHPATPEQVIKLLTEVLRVPVRKKEEKER